MDNKLKDRATESLEKGGLIDISRQGGMEYLVGEPVSRWGTYIAPSVLLITTVQYQPANQQTIQFQNSLQHHQKKFIPSLQVKQIVCHFSLASERSNLHEAMPTSESQNNYANTKPLDQPWKKSWPPATEKKVGEKYGVTVGGELLVDGGGIVSEMLLLPKKE